MMYGLTSNGRTFDLGGYHSNPGAGPRHVCVNPTTNHAYRTLQTTKSCVAIEALYILLSYSDTPVSILALHA
jgi:hypothetical protein